MADLLLIVVPPLLGLWDWSTSFYRGMALLVASSPCALALGTPSAVLAGIAQAARNGVLITGAPTWRTWVRSGHWPSTRPVRSPLESPK